MGVTYNLKNTSVDYRSGIDSHGDWAASQFLSERWHVGIVGYAYRQLTADTYPTSGLAGALRSQGVGPQVGSQFTVRSQQAYLNLRGYKEFWAQHCAEGYAPYATVSVQIGSAKKIGECLCRQGNACAVVLVFGVMQKPSSDAGTNLGVEATLCGTVKPRAIKCVIARCRLNS
jgi:hypothetical protein